MFDKVKINVDITFLFCYYLQGSKKTFLSVYIDTPGIVNMKGEKRCQLLIN